MRLAIPGSLLVHGGVAALAMGFVTLTPPAPLPMAEVVSVDIIATHSFSTNSTEVLASDATFTARSAGGVPVAMASLEPVTPDTIRPVVQEPVEMRSVAEAMPVRETVEARPAKVLEPEPGLPVLATAVNRLRPASVAVAPAVPMQVASLEPMIAVAAVEAEASDVPMPMPRIAERPERVEPVRKTQPKKVVAKTKPPAKQKTATRAANQGGNGGNNSANSRASAARSSAAVGNYPGKIVSKLRRALRYPKGGRISGEAHVQFVVAANGRASSIRVVRSSGDARLDAAALETVQRAAPFPAIPAEAGRSNWTFTVPLVFRR